MKKSLFLALSLLAFGCAAEVDDPVAARSGRIIGGEPIKLHEFPAVASIIVGNNLCTGTLIDPRWVLTAAHCVYPPLFGLDKDDIDKVRKQTTVAFDRLDIFVRDGREVKARRIVVHPDFETDFLKGHDIALIELADEITDREPMPYSTAVASHLGQEVTFVGFGKQSTDADETELGRGFKLAQRTVIPCSTLGPLMPLGDDKMLCFDQRDGKGFCGGDSGGPAIAQVGGVPTVVGISDFVFDASGVSCDAFGASTRTDIFADFITATLESKDDEGGCTVAPGRGARGGAGLALMALLGLALVRVRRRV